LIDFDGVLSVRRQCELLDINRSSLYRKPKRIDANSLLLMKLIDEEYTRHPFYGTRRMKVYLYNQGHCVNRKLIQRLYNMMGLEAVYQKPNLSKESKEHKKYPYLLRGIEINHQNQVWSSDITFVRLKYGFVYLMAIIDWFSRYVLDWELSIGLEADFCIDALARVLNRGRCDIFNTDQGSVYERRFYWVTVIERCKD
jgi:putative transposase